MTTTTQQRCPTPGCNNPRREEFPGTCERHTQRNHPWEPCFHCGETECNWNNCMGGE